MAECAHGGRHVQLEPRDRLEEDGLREKVLPQAGIPRCERSRCGLGMVPEPEGREAALPLQRDPALCVVAFEHVRWLCPFLVSANRCLFAKACFDSGCVEPFGKGEVC
jgi:hypothetical protein